VNVVNIVREVVSSRPVVHHGGTTTMVWWHNHYGAPWWHNHCGVVAQSLWCTMVAQPYISASHPLLQNWHLGKKNL